MSTLYPLLAVAAIVAAAACTVRDIVLSEQARRGREGEPAGESDTVAGPNDFRWAGPAEPTFEQAIPRRVRRELATQLRAAEQQHRHELAVELQRAVADAAAADTRVVAASTTANGVLLRLSDGSHLLLATIARNWRQQLLVRAQAGPMRLITVTTTPLTHCVELVDVDGQQCVVYARTVSVLPA